MLPAARLPASDALSAKGCDLLRGIWDENFLKCSRMNCFNDQTGLYTVSEAAFGQCDVHRGSETVWGICDARSQSAAMN